MLTRKVLGQCAKVGSLYDANTDNIVGDDFVDVRFNESKIDVTHGDNKLNDTAYMKFNILGVHDEHHLNILLGETKSNSISKFLMNKSKHDTSSLVPFEFQSLFLFEYVACNRKMKMIEENFNKIKEKAKKMKVMGYATHIVTSIKCGFRVIAVLKFSNKNGHQKEYLNDYLFKLTQKMLVSTRVEEFANPLNNFVRVDFVLNHHPSKVFANENLISFFDCIKQTRVKNDHPCPIELELTQLKEIIKNDFREIPLLTSEMCEKMLRNYYDFDELLDQFQVIKEKSHHYAQFMNEIILNRINDDAIKTNLNKTNFIESLRKCKLALHTTKFNSIQESFMDCFKNQIEIVKSYDVLLKKLKEIEFYERNGIRVLNKYCRNMIDIPNKSLILCYNDMFKCQNFKFWEKCYGAFMHNSMTQSQNCVVYDYDLCNLNVSCLNSVHLLSYDNKNFFHYAEDLSEPPNSSYVVEATKIDEPQVVDQSSTIEIPAKKNINEINILLLGETGVGKSTFINAFLNYTKYASLEEAEVQQEISSLIASQFLFTDEFNKQHKISIGTDENECFIDGQSSTQKAKAYEFELDDKLVRIIDTPGMGDSRGVHVDKKNFEETIAYISQFEKLNAICFLIKPNNARLHPGFRYCFKELLTHLHKNTVANICFCFTNSRSTLYKPGETMPALQGYLKEINELSNVNINLIKSNTFCFDNEAFRYLAILKNKLKIDEKERGNFSNSWKRTSEASLKMLNYIGTLNVLIIKETIMVNNNQKLHGEWSMMAFKCLQKLATEWREAHIHRKLNNSPIKSISERVVFISSIISNYCCKNSLAVFNDELEALLEQAIREENRMQCINKEHKALNAIYKKMLISYRDQKHKNLIAGTSQILIDDYFNELIDLHEKLFRK